MASRLLSLTRVIHMFQDVPGESLDSNAANNNSAFVSMYVNEELERAFTLPVMSVALSWSREMLAALMTFCRYQMVTAGSYAELRAEVGSYDVICSMSWLNIVSCVLFPGKSHPPLGQLWPVAEVRERAHAARQQAPRRVQQTTVLREEAQAARTTAR